MGSESTLLEKIRRLLETAAGLTPPVEGLPGAEGVDVAGADTYTTVYTCPARVCRRLKVSLDAGYDAILSLDGGTTEHFRVKANTMFAIDGLALLASAVLQGKNVVNGENYTNLRIVAW